MSASLMGNKKTATPSSKRRAPASNENGQPTRSKRSLSDRLRNLFGRDSSAAKTRPTSNDRRQPSPDSPQLRPPTVAWPGKKKSTTNKNNEPPRPIEISSPINTYSSNTRTETFVPRTPTTGGFREQMIIDDRTTQVHRSEIDAYPPPSYTSDRSRSPSMTYARPTPLEADYYFYNERQPRPTAVSMTDVEVLSTPQRRRVNDIATSNPVLRPPLATSTNSLQYRSSSSSTGLARADESPKLKPPSSPFGSTSNKKKEKKSKSKTRSDGIATVSQLLQQNPLDANQARTTGMYGSLPDAEPIYDGTANSIRPGRFTNNKYPYISAIVEHHLRPTTVRLPDRPLPPTTTGTISTVTTTGTNVLRPARFDTSTTTLDNQRPHWSEVQPQPDGFIRPITPEVGVVRIGVNISTNGQTSPPSPTVYRSSTTIYARDKNHRVEYEEDRGRPVERKPPVERREDPIVVPPKIRYTPPTLVKPVQHFDEDDEVQEERYEVSYQYERQLEEYSYDTRQYHDETHLNQRYADDLEREQNYLHQSRSYNDQQHFRQESSNVVTPVYYSKASPQTYTLSRIAGYDGLGIFVATDAETQSQHFIREVEVGSPGYRAGLRKNDRIISVNNVNVEKMDFSNVLLLIKQGLDHDSLRITVIHELDSI